MTGWPLLGYTCGEQVCFYINGSTSSCPEGSSDDLCCAPLDSEIAVTMALPLPLQLPLFPGMCHAEQLYSI
jgi:hypothetical protein